MSTLNAEISIDSQIVTQTAAEWAVDTDVYPVNRILVVSDLLYTDTDQPRFKFSNGVNNFAGLDFVPAPNPPAPPVTSGGSTSFISYFNLSNVSLVDGATLFLGQTNNAAPTVNAFAHIPLPDCTLRGFVAQTYFASNASSPEGITATLKTSGGAVSTVLTNILTFTSRHIFYERDDLDVEISAGDSWLEISVPIMAINPSAVQFRFNLQIETNG